MPQSAKNGASLVIFTKLAPLVLFDFIYYLLAYSRVAGSSANGHGDFGLFIVGRLALTGERELAQKTLALRVNDDFLPGLDVSIENLLGQCVFDFALNCTAQRAGAQYRVVTLFGQERLGVLGDPYRYFLFCHSQ